MGTTMGDLLQFTGLMPLVLSLCAGAGLGLLFFGGLWWTVRRLPMARHPAPLALGSLVVRLGGSLAGFYLVMDGHWVRLLACLTGFLLARTLLVRRLQPLDKMAGLS